MSEYYQEDDDEPQIGDTQINEDQENDSESENKKEEENVNTDCGRQIEAQDECSLDQVGRTTANGQQAEIATDTGDQTPSQSDFKFAEK